MMAQASGRPAPCSALDSGGWFDERSLFADIMNYELTVEEHQGIDAIELTTAPPTDGALSNPAEDTFESFFKAIDDSFDLFDLELEFSMGLSTFEPLPVLCNLSSQVTTISCTSEPSPRDPAYQQPQPKKRKKSLKTSSQRQREEIKSLRATASHLEDQLRIIRAVTTQGSSSLPAQSLSSGGDARTESQSLWECVARRQETARHQAEQINAALRKNLKMNLKLATSLEQSLRCK